MISTLKEPKKKKEKKKAREYSVKAHGKPHMQMFSKSWRLKETQINFKTIADLMRYNRQHVDTYLHASMKSNIR